MTARRLLISLWQVAAVTAVLVSINASDGRAADLGQIGVEDGDPCLVSAESPTGQALTPAGPEGAGYLSCPTASPANVLRATLTVCAQRAGIIMIYRLTWEQIDLCTRRGPLIIDQGVGLYTVSDTVPCGTIPLYRTTVYADIEGWPKRLTDTSDPRPSGC